MNDGKAEVKAGNLEMSYMPLRTIFGVFNNMIMWVPFKVKMACFTGYYSNPFASCCLAMSLAVQNLPSNSTNTRMYSHLLTATVCFESLDGVFVA